LIKTTAVSGPASPDVVNPNLREVIVNGAGESASFSSLKPVAISSTNERSMPVRLNGKAYRGKLEVFVNSRGNLTVVNVVSLEDYLLGVVPSELSLPQLEAQKAQAVAARTYAVANINQFSNKGFDLLPTVSSQVYGGVNAESRMGTQAVLSTRGIVATYNGKPINAMYTST
jgi:stage II sporulation protein D